jgi:hypothetical protein
MNILLDGSEVQSTQKEVIEKVKKVGLFDFMNDLTSDKNYLFDDTSSKEFNAFMINRGMGQQPDLIMYANEMNKSPGLSKEMVHDFYFYAIKAKKRYGKWAKSSDDNKAELDLIMNHYTVNRNVAVLYLELLSKDELENLKKLNEKGGRAKK